MRKLSPAYVVTSVVIAAAGTTFAQAAAPPAGAVVGGTGSAAVLRSVTAPASVATSTGTTSNTTTGNTTGNTSGNTTANTGTSSTSTTASANGTTGATSANGTTASIVPIPGALVAPGVITFVNPALINGTMGGITSEGERVVDSNGNVYDVTNANLSANAPLQYNGSVGTSVAVDTLRSSQDFDRAVKQVERDRKKIGRNGQLLQSIAPRTNVDRTNQMPDDGISPTLTGYYSALTRQ